MNSNVSLRSEKNILYILELLRSDRECQFLVLRMIDATTDNIDYKIHSGWFKPKINSDDSETYRMKYIDLVSSFNTYD